MLNYENIVSINRRTNVERRDVYGNKEYALYEKTCSLETKIDGEIVKKFDISVSSMSEIDLNLDVQDVRIEAYDSASMAKVHNGEMRYYFNPDDQLYEKIKNIKSVRIASSHTNSSTDIVISRTVLVDETVVLLLSGVNLEYGDHLIIEVDPMTSCLYDYYDVLDLYRLFEDSCEIRTEAINPTIDDILFPTPKKNNFIVTLKRRLPKLKIDNK